MPSTEKGRGRPANGPECHDLWREIKDLWGGQYTEFRGKLAAKTGQWFSRQRVNRWSRTGVPPNMHEVVRQVIDETRAAEVD